MSHELMDQAEEVGSSVATDIDGTVSVVVVNYNTAELTKQCVDSIENSEYPVSEVIVVDNASEDDERERLEELLSDATIHYLQENRGFAGGCNYGAEVATGNYLFFLTSDAVMVSGTIRELVEDIRSPEVGAVVPQVRLEHDRDLIDKGLGALDDLGFGWHPNHLRPVDSEEVPTETCETLWGSGCAMLVDSAVFSSIGGFDDDFFMYMEDLELCLRLREQGLNILYEPESVVLHRFSRSVKEELDYGKNSFQIYHQNMNRAKVLTKHFPLELLARRLPIIILSFVYWNTVLARRGGLSQSVQASVGEVKYAVQGLKEREEERDMEWTDEIQRQKFSEYLRIGLNKSEFYETVKE